MKANVFFSFLILTMFLTVDTYAQLGSTISPNGSSDITNRLNINNSGTNQNGLDLNGTNDLESTMDFYNGTSGFNLGIRAENGTAPTDLMGKFTISTELGTANPLLVIQPNGYFGLGTNAPSVPFQVVGTDLEMGEIRSNDLNGTTFRITNTSALGDAWGLISTGNDATDGGGNLLIKNFDHDRVPLFIEDDKGRIGMGTFEPDAHVHMIDSSSFNSFNMLRVESNSNIGTAFSIKNSYSEGQQYEIISTSALASEGSGKLLFKNFDQNDIPMAIDSTGKVGVGTFLPTDRLTVQDSMVSSTGGVIHATFTETSAIDRAAIRGTSVPADGYGYGVVGEGGYMGVRGLNDSGDYEGSTYGGYFTSTGNAGVGPARYGVYGSALGGGGTGSRYGVYGSASGGAYNWAGFFHSGNVYVSNDLRIGTIDGATGYKVSVDGKVMCEELKIQDSGSWPDYVFENDYELRTLAEVEESINTNGHLPGIPSAAEVEANGILVAQMQKMTMEKVEELTLYAIDADKKIKTLTTEKAAMEKDFNEKLEILMKRIEALEKK